MSDVKILILKVTKDYVYDVLDTSHFYTSTLPAEEKLTNDFILLGQCDLGPYIAGIGKINDIRKITDADVDKLTYSLKSGYDSKQWKYIYDLDFEVLMQDFDDSQEYIEIMEELVKDSDDFKALIGNEDFESKEKYAQTFGYKHFSSMNDFDDAKNYFKDDPNYQVNEKFLNLGNNINTNIANLRKLHQNTVKQTAAAKKAQANAAAAKQAAILNAQLQEANRIQHILDCKPDALNKLYKVGDPYKVKKHNPNGLVKIKVYDAVITDVENITWHDPTDPSSSFVCGQKLMVRINALNEDAVYEVGTINIVQ